MHFKWLPSPARVSSSSCYYVDLFPPPSLRADMVEEELTSVHIVQSVREGCVQLGFSLVLEENH